MKKYSFNILLFILFLGLFSCKKSKDLNEPIKEVDDYFPLKVGGFRIYQIKKSTYGLTGQTDSVFQLKEVYKETWTDLEGDASFKIFRYKKIAGASEFVLDSIWHAKIKSNQVIETENNVPYVKQFLPLNEGKFWNGNAFNTYGVQNYEVKNLAKPWGNFENTVTIVQKNVSNLLFRTIANEVYAKDIGLIYKEMQDVKLEFNTGQITEGIVMKQTILSYGKE